jgi:hypothetical protein
VFAIVLLRRAIPHGIAIIDSKWIGGIVVLLGWIGAMVLRQVFELERRPQEYGEPPVLVAGALFFLGGALYVFSRGILDAVRAAKAAA